MAVATLAPGAASAQTVEDYRTSLREAPILDPAAPGVAELCRPLMNFVYVEIPQAERSQPWIHALFDAFSDDNAADGALDAKRTACLAVRDRAVIDFANASGEQIVTPPEARDPAQARTAW